MNPTPIEQARERRQMLGALKECNSRLRTIVSELAGDCASLKAERDMYKAALEQLNGKLEALYQKHARQ